MSCVFFLPDHVYFVGVQFHPEYISRPMTPSAPYLGLLLASCNKLQQYATRGFRPSPRMSFCESDIDDSDGEEVAVLTSKTAEVDLCDKNSAA